MQRTCDGTDPNLLDIVGDPCNCGMTFDDVDRTVIYPHLLIVGITRVYNRENNWGYDGSEELSS